MIDVTYSIAVIYSMFRNTGLWLSISHLNLETRKTEKIHYSYFLLLSMYLIYSAQNVFLIFGLLLILVIFKFKLLIRIILTMKCLDKVGRISGKEAVSWFMKTWR